MEKVVQFGNHRNLVGVLSSPQEPLCKPPVGIILFNAGLIHHIGPFRMSVDLARSLEREGFPVLRFDFSGIGDSGNCAETLTDEQRIISEYNAAAKVLTQYCNCDRFILFGLCSGADNAHLLMKHDPRIRGIIPIDGYSYRTLRYIIKDYGPATVNPKKWVKYGVLLFKKYILSKISTSLSGGLPVVSNEIYKRPFPPKAAVMTALDARLADGMKALFIFSGGIPIYYNYANQFWDMYRALKNKKHLQCNYYKGANHTFSNPDIRKRMIADVVEWCVKSGL